MTGAAQMDAALLAEIERAAATPQFTGIASYPTPVPGRVMDMDGDYLAYYDGSRDRSEGEARCAALERIEDFRLRSGSESVLMHTSHATCNKAHRYIIATVKPYQGKRKSAKPVNWRTLRDLLENYKGRAFTPMSWKDREADDGIAYAAQRGNRVICTRDKDMRMLPGVHINWMTYHLTTVPPGAWDVMGEDGLQYGLKWFYLQLLQGDSVDNIPGVPKLNGQLCADTRATKHLAGTKSREEAYEKVKGAYQAHYSTAWADALAEQAALLWLRTDKRASIHNVAEGFPVDVELLDAIDRLDKRVKERLHELQLD